MKFQLVVSHCSANEIYLAFNDIPVWPNLWMEWRNIKEKAAIESPLLLLTYTFVWKVLCIMIICHRHYQFSEAINFLRASRNKWCQGQNFLPFFKVEYSRLCLLYCKYFTQHAGSLKTWGISIRYGPVLVRVYSVTWCTWINHIATIFW